MDNLKDHLDNMIPYRMRAVSMLTMALAYKIEWQARPKKMKIYFEDKVSIEGNSNLFFNAVLEAGLIHARALLDFAGLRLNPKNYERLKQRKKLQHPEDIVIENYRSETGFLSRVKVRDIVERYSNITDDVEKTLATLISTTNKCLVHSTVVGLEDRSQLKILRSGSEIVPLIMVDYLYKPLGLPTPRYKVRSRTVPDTRREN